MVSEKKAAAWVQQGLITAEQKEKIIAYERSKRLFSPMTAFLGIGALAVGLGIVSLVAAHWAALSDTVKLGGYFLLITLFSGACAFVHEKKPSLFETGLIVHALLILAGIGLVAQVFHLNGVAWQTMTFYAVLLLPLSAVSRDRTLVFVEIPLVFFAFVASPVGEDVINCVFSKYLLPTTIVLMSFSALVAMVFLEKKTDNRFCSVLKLYLFVPLFSPLFIPAEEFSSVKGNALPMEAFITLAGAAALYGAMRYVTVPTQREKPVLTGMTALYGGFAVLVAMAQAMPFFRPFVFGITPLFQALILGAIAIWFCTNGKQRLFTLTMFLLGWRVFEFFMVAFSSLLGTGVGLIAFGLAVWGTAYGIHRLKKRIQTRFAGTEEA